MPPGLLIYFLIGFIEYVRLGPEYSLKMRADFPYHDPFFLELIIVVGFLLFGLPFLLLKFIFFCRGVIRWVIRAITLPFKVWRFRRTLDKIEKEKNSQKAAEMFFEAIRKMLEDYEK